MPDNFEWKTEEDGRWEEELVIPTPPQTRRRLSWRTILTILAVLMAGTVVVRSRINQQVAAATADVKANVVAAHNFLQRTAQQQDVDLLKAVISGREPDWADAQKELVEEGWFGAPPFLGWNALSPPLATTENVTVTLSPDLRAAELQITNTYQAVNSEGVTETVELLQTAVYRQGNDRWLLAPPEAAFWGDQVTQRGDYITLTYPQRDEAIAQELLPDLDALVDAVCHDLQALACPDRYRLQLRLDSDVRSLLRHADPQDSLLVGTTLVLPAPSLLGQPVDETSYQALYRAYGVQVGTAVITELTDYQCCRWVLLYQGILDRQLHQLGLKPWPLDEAAYNRLFNSHNVSTRLEFLLVNANTLSDLEQLRLYAFVEFLEHLIVPEVPLAELQMTLDEPSGIVTWLNEYTPETFDYDSVNRAFFQYIYSQTTAGQMTTPPISYPAPEIQLVCHGNGRSVTIHQYDLAAQSWRQVFHYDPLNLSFWAYAQKVDNRPDSYWIMAQATGETSETHYALVEQSRVTASFTRNTGGNNYYPRNADPTGRYLTLNLWQEREAPAVSLLDLEACRQGECEPMPIEGELFWSADGRHTLIQPSVVWSWEGLPPDEWPMLSLGDEQGSVLREIGRGRWPFWLDDQTYAYQRINAYGEVELVSAVVGQDEAYPLLTLTDLVASLPAESRGDPAHLGWVYADPANPANLFVWAFPASERAGAFHLFAVELTPDLNSVSDVERLYTHPDNAYVEVAPNGRWLTIYEYQGRSTDGYMLLNRETGEEHNLGPNFGIGPVWSADGNWYLLNQENHLILGAPDHDYKQLVFHNFVGCDQAYWLEK